MNYEYIWILLCTVNFKVSFFFYYFNIFFFKRICISFLYEWAILSYNYDHVICIYTFLFYFILFLYKFDIYISIIYINSVLWLGVFLGSQWALYAYIWGFYWNRDMIECVELLFIFWSLVIIHQKKSFNKFFYIFINLCFVLLLMLVMRRGFLKSIHNFFNKFLVSNSYIYFIVGIFFVINIYCFLGFIYYFITFLIKIIISFLPLNHMLLFWILFLFLKFYLVKKLIYCFFVIDCVNYIYIYYLKYKINVFFFFFKAFVYNVWYDFQSLSYNVIDHVRLFVVYISYSLFFIIFNVILIFIESYV
jgi:hypothetical protein